MFIESVKFLGKKYLQEKEKGMTDLIDLNPASVQKAKIDKKDFEILSAISKDSGTTLLALAKKTKLSSNAVSYRRASLEKKKLIVGSTILADQKSLGTQTWKILIKKSGAKKERESAFSSFIARNKNTTRLERYVGSWDLGIEVELPDEEALREFFLEIRNIFSDVIDNHVCVSVTKESEQNYISMKDLPVKRQATQTK